MSRRLLTSTAEISAENLVFARRTLRLADVPAGSKDAVAEGMKAVVREMVRKGLEANEAALADRLRLILDVGEVGALDARAREALATAKTLLSVQRDYRPKDGVDPNRTLTEAEESRVRILGEALAADLYRRLPKTGPRPSSPDVPEWSKDPLLDGMKSIVRELMAKGFAEAEKDSLGSRLRVILEIAAVGDEPGRKREADSLALTLLEIQRDYRPKNAGSDPKRVLSNDEEQRVRIMAEALARDMYRRLPPTGGAGGGTHDGGGSHTGTFRAAPVLKPPPGFEVVTWQTLGGFEYTEGMKLPDDVRKLHGKKVAIAGYMMTLDEVENIRHFLLVESLWSCCFGVPPNVNQVLELRIEGRKGVEFSSMPVMITGTLDVGEKIEDGFVTSVYRIKLDGPTHVKPVE
jgi:hypothetical protein